MTVTLTLSDSSARACPDIVYELHMQLADGEKMKMIQTTEKSFKHRHTLSDTCVHACDCTTSKYSYRHVVSSVLCKRGFRG